MTDTASLIAISAEIGRGHPGYLRSVITQLENVPKIRATGPFWQLARQVYLIGGKGGICTAIYNHLRTNHPPVFLSLINSALCRRFSGYPGIVLVDHPLLARLLAPVCRVAYLHAEIAAPESAFIPCVWRTFVPLPETADQFIAAGARPETLVITGLIIEPELLPQAEKAYLSRCQRLATASPLTVGFFTSGAYPRPHLRAIITAARALVPTGHRIVVFSGPDARMAAKFKAALPPQISIISAPTLEQEAKITADIFPQLDVLVCAAHERTGWAIGLGVPMLSLLPHIGPFAPLNFQFALAKGVSLPLEKPARFGTILADLQRNQTLHKMACAGWDKYPITGAKFTAEYLSEMTKLLPA